MQKQCNLYLDRDGSLTNCGSEILAIEKDFYEKLYDKDENTVFKVEGEPKAYVMDSSPGKNEEHFTDQEIATAVLGLKNNKTPGPDGIGIDFYKVFWGQIGNLICELIRYMFDNYCLIPSSSNGIINLIPKKGRDTRYLKNLRPITLLNSDYKIIEKALANRMIPALDDIIDEDQKGFLPGRRIAVNIRKIFDLIRYSSETDENIVIVNLDYQKAFDMISTDCIIGVLKYYGFSNYITSWTALLYSDFTAKVQNNGYFSECFKVLRSVHQGAPNSCYYFVLVMELLADVLRTNKNIKGITIKDINYLLSQYADDMDSAMCDEEDSIDAFFQTLEWFKGISGLTVNYEKTTLYRVKSMDKAKAERYTAKVKSTSTGINVLGVEIRDNENQACHINYEQIEKKVDVVLKLWARRSLSIEGKVNIINTLIASLFVYKLMVLPSPDENFVKRINKKIGKLHMEQQKAKNSTCNFTVTKKGWWFKAF